MKKTDKSIYGTTYQFVCIIASVENLRKAIGEPTFEQNDGDDKTNFEWHMETNDGEPITIYDWKENRALDEEEMIEWYIGAFNPSAALQGKTELKLLMSVLPIF